MNFSSRLRVLVEPSDYVIRNAGDTAMLQIALERLTGLLPHARIAVFNEDPAGFPYEHPNLTLVSTHGRRRFFEIGRKLARIPSGRRLADLWLATPDVYLDAASRLRLIHPDSVAQIRSFLDEVTRADLVLVTGMGGITDAFPRYADELISVLRMAQRAGARTAMVGQGLGPLEDARRRRAVGTVLRSLDLLGLREQRASLPLAASLGAAYARTRVTGDDAIELAARQRTTQAGGALGVNVRASSYSHVQPGDLALVRQAITHAVRNTGAPILALPISRVPGEEDAPAIEAVVRDVGDPARRDWAMAGSPASAIAACQRCRIVIAGSYHAGVFALSSGVPLVALARSHYYRDKFFGLAEMFGAGCHVVRLDAGDAGTQLERAIEAAWSTPESVRETLRCAADEQVARSRAVFVEVAALVGDAG